MKPTKSDESEHEYIFRNDSSIPRTTLKIPMPAGAKQPPPAPAAKSASPTHSSK